MGAFGSLAKAVFLARLGYTFGNPNIILLLGAASLGGPENPRPRGEPIRLALDGKLGARETN